MNTSELTNNLLGDKCFSEEELLELGLIYTSQNFSKYLIFRKENEYFLMDEVHQDQFKVQFNFEEQY